MVKDGKDYHGLQTTIFQDAQTALAGSLCCVLGQDTLLSQCLSPPRSINGTKSSTSMALSNYTIWPSCLELKHGLRSASEIKI